MNPGNSIYFTVLIAFLHCIAFDGHTQTYQDLTTELGINHTFGQDAYGGGISFYDFDQDGWDDLTFATQQGDSLVFYKNTGSTFEEIYFEGVHHAGHVKQILWCDYDNDGDKDLYVSGRSWDNFIYINDGYFVFEPYLLPAPAPYFTGDTYGAAFGDYDLDGDLDLFICNRISSIPLSNQLYRNNGDGSMTDITSAFNFDTLYQLTFCASWIDINNDLKPDLYTAEDRFDTNQIYTNAGNGILSDECDGCGAEIVINAMSVCPGDYDNDGDLDIYVSNTQDGNALLHNNGDGSFTDRAHTAGVSYGRVAWGATFFDYDHDRDLDLYVSGSTNGTTMANRLYNNLDANSFSEAEAGFIGDSTRSFSHAIGDINNDGYYDIAVLNIDPDYSQVWQSSGGENNWVKIQLEGTVSNKDGVGVWIEVWSDGLRQVKYTTCGVGYLAQNSGVEIFGLGPFEQIDSLIIKWPSGIIDKLYDQETNKLISILEASTSTTANNNIEKKSFTIYPNPTNDQAWISYDGLKFENISFAIYNVAGKTFELDKVIFSDNNSALIDIGDLPAGTYFLNIISAQTQETLRIIKLD